MYVKANKRFKEDIKTLHDLCDEVGRLDFLYRHSADPDSLSRLERIVGRDAKISWIGCCTEETQSLDKDCHPRISDFSSPPF